MGRCDSYAGGNCTAGACQENPWVPDDLGDGGDWAFNAHERGFQVTRVPTVGAVVCYCRGDGYSVFGHVATVVAVSGDGRFEVHEMNFVAFDTWDYRWSTDSDLCGFILPPGATPGRGAGLIGPDAGGGAWGLPSEPILAWESVRQWTRDLGAEVYWRARNVISHADQFGG